MPLLLSPILAGAALLLLPAQAPKPQVPALRFQKSLRLPVKARPVQAAPAAPPRQDPGAVVEVRGDGQPLETFREQTLREFREWLVANRFRGSAFAAPSLGAHASTASWDQTHPGGFTVAPLAPLGWGYGP
ncbi:MAG: hypothetical protein U0P81_04140 [Holophagaceae bacterium]